MPIPTTRPPAATNRKGGRARAAIAAAALLSTGCSFLTVRKPPAPPIDPGAELRCTSAPLAPVADVLLGGGALVSAVLLAGLHATLGGSDTETGGMLVAGIGGAALGISSSVYGVGATNACTDLRRWIADCDAGVAASCERLGVGRRWPVPSTALPLSTHGAGAASPPAPPL